jgi:hypothetical protein
MSFGMATWRIKLDLKEKFLPHPGPTKTGGVNSGSGLHRAVAAGGMGWPGMNVDHTHLILITTGFTVGFAAVGAASLLESNPEVTKSIPVAQKQVVVTAADLAPVRIVGTPFVPNINPRERWKNCWA